METTKVYKHKCEICGKVIASFHKGQADYNFKLHDSSCRKKKGANKK